MIRRKLAALTVALFAATGLAIAQPTTPATAAPVQICTYTVNDDNSIKSKVCKNEIQSLNRWGYCNVSVDETYITFFNQQGYCGSRVRMNPPAPNTCRLMAQWDNWAGSLSDNGRGETYHYDTSYCGGLPVLHTVHHQDIPDLYPLGMYHKITSIALG
jgi:hypothetical protein